MSISYLINELSSMADGEMARGLEDWGAFHSSHEAYAVMAEEFEEATDEVEEIRQDFLRMRCCIKNNTECTDEVQHLINTALNAAAELIQVAAMRRKFISPFGKVGGAKDE